MFATVPRRPSPTAADRRPFPSPFPTAMVANTDLMFKQSVWTSVISAQIAANFMAPYVTTCSGVWPGATSHIDPFFSQLTFPSLPSSCTPRSRFLSPYYSKGCIVLTGAVPALGGTPGTCARRRPCPARLQSTIQSQLPSSPSAPIPLGMIGYGMAKAAVHQLTKSLADPSSGLPEGSSAVAILPYVWPLFSFFFFSPMLSDNYLFPSSVASCAANSQAALYQGDAGHAHEPQIHAQRRHEHVDAPGRRRRVGPAARRLLQSSPCPLAHSLTPTTAVSFFSPVSLLHSWVNGEAPPSGSLAQLVTKNSETQVVLE